MARHSHSLMPRWLLARLTTTLAAWLTAFLTVLALLVFLGDELKSLPLALRALVLSGVLVALMVNLVMPFVNRAVARWLATPPQDRSPRGQPGIPSGKESVV